MSNLSFIQKQRIESLLGMGGWYVLDFTTNSFQECVLDATGLDIYSDKYSINWGSKARRLKTLLKVESDSDVAKLLKVLSEYSGIDEILEIADELTWKKPLSKSFEDIPIPKIKIEELGLYPDLESAINQRLHETEICLKNKCFLASVFLCGSTLEWILLNYATRKTSMCLASIKVPKSKWWVPISDIADWKLSELIDVLHDVGIFDENIQKFSHSLRGFRNYIHPHQQASIKFNPDQHTAEIGYKILMIAIDQLTKKP